MQVRDAVRLVPDQGAGREQRAGVQGGGRGQGHLRHPEQVRAQRHHPAGPLPQLGHRHQQVPQTGHVTGYTLHVTLLQAPARVHRLRGKEVQRGGGPRVAALLRRGRGLEPGGRGKIRPRINRHH